eukprot:CAMPEP_0115157640 /NCGR_PEP_ID=MMETSP0227-20121206/69146_1 /TAXON_ID=89957 /ORGANISM="Polarella glacialis, Strain CCMP 1383" /LENGTH=89 /DNA_ID=CAMNT_0002569017 /DNA_START=577 /DNA_END=846 /DNA_ORIENTATION=+
MAIGLTGECKAGTKITESRAPNKSVQKDCSVRHPSGMNPAPVDAEVAEDMLKQHIHKLDLSSSIQGPLWQSTKPFCMELPHRPRASQLL